MKKWNILCVVIILMFIISGCSTTVDDMELPTDTKSIYPSEEEVQETIPVLDSIEYWDIVNDEIVDMLNEHDLYVAAINSSYPCVLYEVEPGKRTEDGDIVATGLSLEEYKELYHRIKAELHIILDKYELAKPKTAFHGCDSIVGLFFHNWFIDENMVYNNVKSRDVAVYELDLLKYYHEHDEGTYICAEGFFDDLWLEHPVYIP